MNEQHLGNHPRHRDLEGLLHDVQGVYRQKERINLGSSKIILDEIDHAYRILNRLNIMRRKELLCDVTISTKEKLFRAHRLVLNQMELFRKMFSDCENDLINLDSMDHNTLEVLINFIYTGRLELYGHEPPKVLCGSDILSDCLKSKLHLSNVFDIRRFAEVQEMSDLLEAVTIFINHNFTEIFDTKDFLEMNFAEMKTLLSRDELCITSENDVVRAAITWIGHNKKKRIDHLPLLISEARIVLLSKAELMQLLEHDFVKESPGTMRRIELAIQCQADKGKGKNIPRRCVHESHSEVERMEKLSLNPAGISEPCED